MRRIDYIVLHCTAGSQEQAVESIKAFWKNVLGWKTPGYHYLYTPDGTEHNLVPIEKPSNGVEGYNERIINLSYVGGVEIIKTVSKYGPVNSVGRPLDNRTPEQRLAMFRRLVKLNEQFPKAAIVGHRDLSPDKNRNGIIEPSEWKKSCPSFSVKEWLQEIGFKSAGPTQFLTTTTTVNVRSGAGIQFLIVCPPLPRGTTVKKLAEGNGWTYVSVNGITGWICSNYLV